MDIIHPITSELTMQIIKSATDITCAVSVSNNPLKIVSAMSLYPSLPKR